MCRQPSLDPYPAVNKQDLGIPNRWKANVFGWSGHFTDDSIMANQKGGQLTYLPSLLVSSTVQPDWAVCDETLI